MYEECDLGVSNGMLPVNTVYLWIRSCMKNVIGGK